MAKTKVPDYLYHKEDALAEQQHHRPNENLHQIFVEALQSNKQQQITPPSSTHLSRKDSMTLRRPSAASTQQQQPQYATITTTASGNQVLEIHQMSSSKLQQDPVTNRIQSEPAPLKPALVSSSSSLSINSSTGGMQDHPQTSTSPTYTTASLVKQRSQSSFTLPRDAPIPRLCRVRAYEDQLGFTVAGSKANRGVFKVTLLCTFLYEFSVVLNGCF